MVLALVNTHGSGRIASDGHVQPAIVDQLSYVMTWNTEACSPVGAPPPSGSSPASVASVCRVVALVDANTGRNLFSYWHGAAE